MKISSFAIGIAATALAVILACYFLLGRTAPPLTFPDPAESALATGEVSAPPAPPEADAMRPLETPLSLAEPSPVPPEPTEAPEVVEVAVPPGSDASVLTIRDLDPLLRLPVSLAPSKALPPLPLSVEIQRERISRDFLLTIARERGSTQRPNELAAAWKDAQRVADQAFLDLVGPKIFREVRDQLNPEIEDRSAVLREIQLKWAKEEQAIRRAALESPGQIDPEADAEARAQRLEARQREIRAIFGGNSPGSSKR